MNSNTPLPYQPDETPRSGSVPVESTVRGPLPAELASQTEATVVPVPAAGAQPYPLGAPTEASLFGRYELLGELARGGMGVVYRARQEGLDRVVALKMILGPSAADESLGQRFLVEARAAAALDHPNVVPVYDSGELDGRVYFTMALVDGPNLRTYVEARGLPPIREAVSLFAQIAAGVAHAHRHGIIHRDLKPANVLIDRDGRPRVTDFGLAKRSAADSQLTATGQVVGTPAYMAPEQARDSKDVGPPADVYGLGAILYFLLTGRPPFEGEGVTDLLIKVVTETPTPPREINPEVPADVEAVCLRCLAKAPADRYPDAQALLAAFDPVYEQYVPKSSAHMTPLAIGFPVRMTPADPSRPGGSAVREPATATFVAPASPAPVPRRRLAAGLAAAAVVLTGTLIYLATRDPRAGGTPAPEPGGQSGLAGGAAEGPAPAVPVVGAWPAPTRADFKLTVELVAPAARKNADGSLLLAAGSPMEIHLRADRACRVAVWVIDPAGEPVRVFPNQYETDDRLVAGQVRVIPPNGGYEFEARPTEGPGTERLRVVATTGEMPAFPTGIAKGQYTFYSGEEREKLASTVRGIAIKKAPAGDSATAAVAEAELPFRVQ